MSITLDGSSLTIEKVVAIARNNEKVELDPAALDRIKVCRTMLEEKLANKEVMYGTNTGIGEFSETMLSDEQVKEFQKYLIYNHAAGIGEPAPIEYVRAALAGRINVHAHGNSGCRPEITLTLVEMLNKGVTPVVCQKGSVGASGDLAPMAQAALLLMGEGEAFYNGERLAGHVAIDGGRRSLLQWRTTRRSCGDGAGRDTGPGLAGTRRSGCDQWVQLADRHVRHPYL
jgi:histidine ammonia-lyase